MRPWFAFNVTIQNHGSYNISEIETSGLPISRIKGKYSSQEDLVAYESLLHQSDVALEYLISYFRDSEESVILLFFGDHQPRLSGDFIDELIVDGTYDSESDFEKSQKRYVVPYFIWANYDVEKTFEDAFRNKKGMTVTSSVYLGVSTEYYANIEMSAFDKYLMNMRKTIPAINKYGYMDNTGQWHLYDETITEDNRKLHDMIADYNILVYANMFDGDRYGELLR